ncbi:MAG: oligopeptide transporter, OPT family, partial [Myxococcaceae bacterium]
FSPGVLLSSGYIAGGAIAGTILAFLRIPKEGAWADALDLPARLGAESGLGKFLNTVGEAEGASLGWSALWGFLFFGALTAFLLRAGLTGESGATASHTPPKQP